ncbi:LAME_0C05644g1_1 [Lachancea meyersii CBS 8951]|uniref:LAME_0C05644g1_1 n=1 Tax=Lachancea meyersii CBS 8951 TaxID=1266667 RepID=A0A1G4J270_9SACH|nr:LAME_0C05644g1_1 [Lachancea meyersii CBS 8951]
MNSASGETDPAQVSQAVDALARSILAQRIAAHQKKPERMQKLASLKQQFDALVHAEQAFSNRHPMPALRLDAAKLDGELHEGLKTVALEGTQYVLLPLVQGLGPQALEHTAKAQAAVEPSSAPTTTVKTNTKKKNKKTKLTCSYCDTPGHTRAHCEKRNLKPVP